jgi:hypothetical protein
MEEVLYYSLFEGNFANEHSANQNNGARGTDASTESEAQMKITWPFFFSNRKEALPTFKTKIISIKEIGKNAHCTKCYHEKIV